MYRSRVLSLALIGVYVSAMGCTSYRQVGINEVVNYDEVRVTLVDGERAVVPRDAFVADSLYLWKEVQPGAHYGKVQVWYPLDQVTLVEARHGDATKTAFCVLGVVGGLVALTVIWCNSGDGCLSLNY